MVTTASGQSELSWPDAGVLDAGTEPGEWDVTGETSAQLVAGTQKLTATCTDQAGNVATDVIEVNVGCRVDADCPADERCCSVDGQCHATVAADAECDCTHPCPNNQGCLPGICDAVPQRCRPGCFPGSDSPPPYGTAPSSCAAQEGLLSFCESLPASEVTPQNMGGACMVGDNCNPITQNCPNLPLDRSQPATSPPCATLSPSCPNPTVPANCVPFAPGVNGCIPAGTIAVCGTGCNQTCGEVGGNCVKGAACTQAVDSNGNPLGPPTCTPADGTDAGCL